MLLPLALTIRCLALTFEADGSGVGAGGTSSPPSAASPPLPHDPQPPQLSQQLSPQQLSQQALWQQLVLQQDRRQRNNRLSRPQRRLQHVLHEWQQLSQGSQQASSQHEGSSQQALLQQGSQQAAFSQQAASQQAFASQQAGSQQGSQHVSQQCLWQQPRSNIPRRPQNNGRRQRFLQQLPQGSQQASASQQAGSQHLLQQGSQQAAFSQQAASQQAFASQQAGSQQAAASQQAGSQHELQQCDPSMRFSREAPWLGLQRLALMTSAPISMFHFIGPTSPCLELG